MVILMPYLWKDIQKEWLLDQQVDYAPEEVIEAFNEVETILGVNLTLAPLVGRGPVVAIPIIELGKVLKIVTEIPNGAALIEKIRDNNPFQTAPNSTVGRKVNQLSYKKTDSAAEYSHALQVARLAAHYRKQSYYVEIEPELSVNAKKRFPDLRVKVNSKWVYLEIVCPIFSKQVQEAYAILGKISNVSRNIKMNTLVEVYLFSLIIEKCMFLARESEIVEFTFNGLAQIFVNSSNEERLPTFAPAIEERRPILVVIGFDLKNENGTAHVRRAIVKMPITDERAQIILSYKSRQLSRSDPGIIVMDVSSIPGGFKRWPELISGRLQPKLNRRITAVVVVKDELTIKKMITRKTVIRHPDPIHQLPEEFFDITTSVT
jgi:hypothetical protein